MIDRDQLREAIASYDEAIDRVPGITGGQHANAVIEAARLVVEGREVWYCEEHDATGNDAWCLQTLILKPKPWKKCRMVRMILIDGNTE